MRIITTLDEMIETARGWLAAGSVGFIPTKGSLHKGHLTLMRAAREECEISVVSIFANPLQPVSSQEAAQYLNSRERDLQLARDAQVDVVFLPHADDMYAATFSTYVTLVGPSAERLGNLSSHIYIQGVATVIAKLFHIVRPDVAYFAQKNDKEIAVVRQVVRDLAIDVQVRVLPTVREQDGLACSHRNSLLSPSERLAAVSIYQALLAGKSLLQQGELRSWVIKQAMVDYLAATPLIRIEYVLVCRPDTFTPLQHATPGTLLTLAARVGDIQLTDNILWASDGQWYL